MAIDRAEVRRIAALARLELDEPSLESLRRDLRGILDHVAMLDELDVTGIEPTVTGADATTGLREDVPRPSLDNATALSNAPDAARAHFRVPRVLAE